MTFVRPLSILAILALGGTALAGGNPQYHRIDRDDQGHGDYRGPGHHGPKGKSAFKRVATYPVYLNNSDADAETVAEIVATNHNGTMLAYTDGEGDQLGFVDISDARYPEGKGLVALGGEPTSVAFVDGYFVAGVNTGSLTKPAGHLAVIDGATRTLVATITLGGQPDSVATSPDGKYIAVAIENERDEDIVVDGVEGGLPQAPAGLLQIIDVKGKPANWSVRNVDLTGLASYGGDDPEPEYVDINHENLAVVSMQENNHIAVVDLKSGKVTSDFDAGDVDLDHIDILEEDVITLDGSLDDVPREPDAITWLPHGMIGTANEGDLFGGSRGFSIFNQHGQLRFDSGNDFEHLAVRHGHYPENRSENKGSEPEAIEYARYGYTDYLFVGSERGSFVGVYKLFGGKPVFSQVLPAGLGPEGLLAIPDRDLFVVSSEVDEPPTGVRATITIYERTRGGSAYPEVISDNDKDGKPIPWSAMSGMVGHPYMQETALAVWDSFYAESRIFEVDLRRKPAVVDKPLTIVGGTGNYDPEGIAIAPDFTYWVASEGNGSDSRQNRILQIDSKSGLVLQEIGLPQEIIDCRAATDDANDGSHGGGFEGIAVIPNYRSNRHYGWYSHKGYNGHHGHRGHRGPKYTLAIAQQRGWDYTTKECEALDDDLNNTNPGEPAHTRIWLYNPANGDWDSVAYELEPITPFASWTGLSEITRLDDGSFLIIERDNRTGDYARLKTLVKVTPDSWKDGIITRDEKKTYDILPDMLATNGWISDKPEGVAVTRDGQVYVITDNDGVDDWNGETQLLRLGSVYSLFK